MPRPELNHRNMSTKSRNPFSAWMARRRENKEALAAAAAKQITDDIAANEMTIVDTLASIDFLHSKLPKEVLDVKSDPNQPVGDLEYASRALQNLIIKNPQTVTVDIRSFDEKLLILAKLFKQSVEQGDERAALAAKGALVRGFSKIRMRIPENQPELAKLFVEANTKYMESWITLVGFSQVADRMKENTERQRQMYNDEQAKHKEAVETLEKLLQTDAEFSEAFEYIMNHDTSADRAQWTDRQRDVHVKMIERRMDKVTLELKQMLLTQDERELATQLGQVETLYSKVAQLPIVADPNLMNKYREQVDELFLEMAESDAKVDETLKLMDDIDGRIEQLENAPGAVRAREVAAEEAEAAVEEIRKAQENRVRNLSNRNGGMLVYSEEQMKEMQAEAQKEEEQLLAQIAAQNVAVEEEAEAEVLYEGM